jgi:hypothetical protein
MYVLFSKRAIIANLKSESMKNFKNIHERVFLDTLGISEENGSGVIDFAHKFRNPQALHIYAGKIKDIPDVKKAFVEDFILPCVKGDFYKKIYNEIDGETNEKSHFNIVFKDRPELLDKWKAGGKKNFQAKNLFNENKEFVITHTKNPFDMFLIGTETNSCQDINGSANLNKCLMGYCLNPSTHAIMIKDMEDDSIVARAIFRMLWDEKKKQPVLLLEPVYLNDFAPLGYEEYIKNYAIERAKDMHVSLVCPKGWSPGEINNNECQLVSYDSGKAPFEYIDSGNGVVSGKVKIRVDIRDFIYQPEMERISDKVSHKRTIEPESKTKNQKPPKEQESKAKNHETFLKNNDDGIKNSTNVDYHKVLFNLPPKHNGDSIKKDNY